MKTLRPLALALVNEEREAGPDEHRCARTRPGKAALKAAERGEVKEVMRAVRPTRGSSAVGPTAVTLLFAAAGCGRLDVVRELLQAGADADVPCHAGWGRGLSTPLWNARRKRKREVAELLRESGAKDDVFHRGGARRSGGAGTVSRRGS